MALTRKERETKTVPALRARTQLGQILKRVHENGERFVIDRRGGAQAVIMSMKDYLGSFAPTPPTMEKLQNKAKKNGLDKMSMRAINQEIKRYRRENSGQR